MKDTNFDLILKSLADDAVVSEGAEMSSPTEDAIPENLNKRANRLIQDRDTIYIPVRKSLLTALVAALIISLLSTTCLAVPAVRDQISQMLFSEPKESSEELLSKELFVYNGQSYTVFDLQTLDDVTLNKIAGAGGALYRFLDKINEISGSKNLSESVLSRLASPYTVTELYGNGYYRERLQTISGQFLTLEGATEFLASIEDDDSIKNSDLPLFYHFVVYCNITEEELYEKNKLEAASPIGYALTNKEIRLLTSGDTDKIRAELSEDVSFYCDGKLYSPLDLAYCPTENFIALMDQPGFTEHLCRLGRTYVLDGTDVGSYRDWMIERYLFYVTNK